MTNDEIKKAREIIDAFDPTDSQSRYDVAPLAKAGWPKALDEIERLRTENRAYSVRAENDARRIEAWKAAALAYEGSGHTCHVFPCREPQCKALEAARALEENE